MKKEKAGKRITLLAGIVILLIAAVLVLAAKLVLKGNDRKELEKVRLNEVAHSIFYAPQYAAIELGYFEEEGIELELTTGFGADKVMTALISGDADIGFMGSEASIFAYAEGANDPAISFAQLTQRAGNFLVSRNKDESFKWEDLIGKNVLGGRESGMPEMVFEYILKKNGIDPKDVCIDKSIDFGLTGAAFKNGQGDYTVEFEPHATLLEKEGAGYVIASLGVDSGYVPYTAYCVKESYLKGHDKQLQGFTNAIQKGLDFVNSHSAAETAKVIAPQFPDTDITTITTIVDRYLSQKTWKEDTVFSAESFELLQNIIMEAGYLTDKVDYRELVITEYSEKAKK